MSPDLSYPAFLVVGFFALLATAPMPQGGWSDPPPSKLRVGLWLACVVGWIVGVFALPFLLRH